MPKWEKYECNTIYYIILYFCCDRSVSVERPFEKSG